ncbi:MAG: hypothetical protein ABS949_16670 [Solibacillus sp.]
MRNSKLLSLTDEPRKHLNKKGAIFVVRGFIITSKETLAAEWNNLSHFTPNIFFVLSTPLYISNNKNYLSLTVAKRIADNLKRSLITIEPDMSRNAKTGWTTVELYLAYIVWLKKQKADGFIDFIRSIVEEDLKMMEPVAGYPVLCGALKQQYKRKNKQLSLLGKLG